jgi:hypothetical protein
MIVLDLSILNQKGTPMFNSDLTANRPAAGIVGRIFIAIDSPYGIFRDTGSAWDQISAGGGAGISGSGAATQVAFWNGTSSISGSNNLYWDSTNNNLGINTNTPGNALDVHGGTISTLGAFNQTTATNNTLLAFLNTNTPLWRIGNFYTGGANDFSVFDVIGNLQQFTIVNTTGQTFVGAKITASGRFVINSATADAHLQIVGANSPSIRIDNAGSGGTQRFVFGLATATNNFIQGSTAGQFCLSTQSAGDMLFGMWQTTNAIEVMRITTTNNLQIGSATALAYASKFQLTGDAYITGVLRETVTTNTQTASYSLVLNDNGKLVLMNVSTANNLTIPLNSSINFPVGTKIDIQQTGAGQTTIVATGGVTINSAGGALKLRVQYSGATLVQTATDVWSLFGDITT